MVQLTAAVERKKAMGDTFHIKIAVLRKYFLVEKPKDQFELMLCCKDIVYSNLDAVLIKKGSKQQAIIFPFHAH